MLTPAEQYRALVNRLERIQENGPDRQAPGPNQSHVERGQQYRPSWPAQSKHPDPPKYDDEEGFNKWWNSLSDEDFETGGWRWLIRLISTTYQIPAVEVTSWVTDYKEQAHVKADPTLDEPESAGPYLYMRIVKWGRQQWDQRPLDLEPPQFDPRVHGGRVPNPMDRYFTRDIDNT